jgi:hypothetical protein
LNATSDAATKLVPFTVSVKAAPPAAALLGDRLVIVGDGLLIVNGKLPEGPPPGAGVVTETFTVAAVRISAAVIAAVTCVALTNVVCAADPLKITTEVVVNPVPFTVSVNAAPPAVVLVGDSVVTVGAGLLTVNVAAADVPPPGAGLVTVTFTVPPVAMAVAGMAAVSCVALTNVVVTAAPLKLTAEVETKFVPFTVSVNAAPPAVALEGERLVIAGSGLLTVKVAAAEVPPPGAGFVTVTLTVLGVAISVARIAAVNWVALTNVVAFAAPLKFTVAPLTKPVPVTVRVKAAPPAVALLGESEVMTGGGLVTLKLTPAEVPPPGAGLVTVTGNVPTVAISAVVIAAVTWVELTKVVILADPLKFTVAPLTKFVPVTVRVNAAPPAVALEGERAVIAGTGLLTVSVWVALVPPPGVGFVTLTLTDPAVLSCVAGIVIVKVSPPLETAPPESAFVPKLTTEAEMKFVPVKISVTD